MSFQTGILYYGDKDQFLVQTPYGKGLVTKIRREKKNDDGASQSKPMKEIRLLEWENAKSSTLSKSRRHTILYSSVDYDSVPAKRGDDVITPYGRGTITEFVTVRLRNTGKFDPITKEPLPESVLTKFHVTLNNWRLAGRSRVKCYLFSNQVKVVRKKTLMEMNALERIEFSLRQKQGATVAFTGKKYQEALNIYAGCIDAVRYIQHDTNSNNECRADLVELMVTCSNNAATCCVQLKMWDEGLKYAKNAFILLSALFKKKGNKIHNVLNRDNGHCDAKLFGEWRVKSHILMAKALLEKKEYEFAIEELKFAREHIAYFVTGEGSSSGDAHEKSVLRLRNQDREVIKLKAKILEQRKIELKKERARAQAMFAKDKPSNGAEQNAKGKMDTQPLSASSNDPKGQAPGKKSNETKPMSNPQTQNKSTPDLATKDENPPKGRRVSFASKLEEKREFEIEEEEEEAWYEEHTEALALLALGGLSLATFFFARGRK